MAEWIKLSVSTFDDDKVKLMEAMPEGDTVVLIWMKLMVLAGKLKNGGVIELGPDLPYTSDMLATSFSKKPTTVSMALSVYEKMGMIEYLESGAIMLSNWVKHQSYDKLEQGRKNTAKRVAKHRQKKREEAKQLLQRKTLHVTPEVVEKQQVINNVTDVTPIDKELDLELDNKYVKLELDAKLKKSLNKSNQKHYDSIVEIVEYFKKKSGKSKTSYHARGPLRAMTSFLNAGYQVEDFKKVIDYKIAEFQNTDKEKYIQLATFFRLEKFESNLDAANNATPGESKTSNIPPEWQEEYQKYLNWVFSNFKQLQKKKFYYSGEEFIDLRTDQTITRRKFIYSDSGFQNKIKEVHSTVNQKVYLMNNFNSMFDYTISQIKKEANR